MKEFFDFNLKKIKKKLGDKRRERRNVRTTEQNEGTLALFKNLVLNIHGFFISRLGQILPLPLPALIDFRL